MLLVSRHTAVEFVYRRLHFFFFLRINITFFCWVTEVPQSMRKEPRKMHGRCYRRVPIVPRVWFGHVRAIVVTDIAMLVVYLGWNDTSKAKPWHPLGSRTYRWGRLMCLRARDRLGVEGCFPSTAANTLDIPNTRIEIEPAHSYLKYREDTVI